MGGHKSKYKPDKHYMLQFNGCPSFSVTCLMSLIMLETRVELGQCHIVVLSLDMHRNFKLFGVFCAAVF